MKKILLLFLFTGVVILLASYFIIPVKIQFGKVVYIQTNINSAHRYMYNETKWQKWWPDKMHNDLPDSLSNKLHYNYKNYSYIIQQKMHEGMNISVENNKQRVNSFFRVIALNSDSVAVEWNGQLSNEYNPFKKVSNYLLARRVKKNISEILENAKIFLENNENVYGLKIIQQQVKDTLLISTRYPSKSYPSNEMIYTLIKNLKEYISLNGAIETNSPMLNISQDGSVFNTMVAIPINMKIPEKENFVLKKMVPGKILVTEVKGGIYTTKEALKQLETYMDDNRILSPALHFESLITDRTKETDTAKWVTKIYYPAY